MRYRPENFFDHFVDIADQEVEGVEGRRSRSTEAISIGSRCKVILIPSRSFGKIFPFSPQHLLGSTLLKRRDTFPRLDFLRYTY